MSERAGESARDSRWIVHEVCGHTQPFDTCEEGSCPALRAKEKPVSRAGRQTTREDGDGSL